MEDVTKRCHFKLLDSECSILKQIRQPTFICRIIINEETNLTLIEARQTRVQFDKPMQVGTSILDLAKCVILDFHYGVMKKIMLAGSELQLMYGDNDSLCYRI